MQFFSQHALERLFWMTILLTGFFPSADLLAQRPIEDAEGLSIVSWSNADQVVGRTAIVTGKIVDVGRAGRVHFLNFDAKRRDVFKIVVFQDNIANFPQSLAALYHNQLITVRGRVVLYKDVPQIEVASPQQIHVVDKLPSQRILEPKRRKLTKRVRVATFNVRNLFDDVDDPYYADETTRAKPRVELEHLAATINEIDAEVMALQEVESRGYLQRFNDVFLGDMSYEIVHYAGNDGRGSGLAVLTRVPVGRVVSHRHLTLPGSTEDAPRKFSRDLLCVELRHPLSPPFEVWVTHLKSKRGGAAETEPQRLAEARAIRALLADRLEDAPTARILVMGDFNDTRNSNPIRHLLGDDSLESFHDMLPATAVTYTRKPYREMIDFIFASPTAARDYVPKSYRIHARALSKSGSDHNAVIAEFEF